MRENQASTAALQVRRKQDICEEHTSPRKPVFSQKGGNRAQKGKKQMEETKRKKELIKRKA